ncbi:CARDB domain-containing protein [Candidatus Ventrimonas sp. KK005]
MKEWRRWLALSFAVIWMVGTLPITGWMEAQAYNDWITTTKVPTGKTGKQMTISFRLKNKSGEDGEFAVRFCDDGVDIGDEDEDDLKFGYAFPFEVTDATFDNWKSVGKIRAGDDKSVSLSGRVRRDLQDGYYTVPIEIGIKDDDGQWGRCVYEDIRVWITHSTSTSDDDDDTSKTYDFVLGEGQSTPDGSYPNVMNFAIRMRNNSSATVYRVKASIVPAAETEKFPFEINDVNYDRMFEKIEKDETVDLGYSFAIREDAYSGYYPISMKIYYSDSSNGDALETFETSFYVRIHNKDKEDEYGEFNEHDRTRARIIVDGFTTIPETIIAGDEFELILKIKNASSDIGATNLLFSMESEKVSDSAVFTTESGSSSVALNSLPPGGVTELKYKLLSRPGVDQRSYGLTIKAKYDSPEYKNAEESLVVDIPVKQIARLSTGTFEVMPDSITVGSESNIMFGINNTGKVMLYNVTAAFEADSIQTMDTYVGNIKPGETGNVDCMVTGVAQTEDDGKIKVIISYEDENGTVFTEEKELTLFVTEDMSSMEDIDVGAFDGEEPMEEKSPVAAFLEQHQKKVVPVSLAAAVILAVGIVNVVKRRKAKAALESDEDEEE